MNGSSDRTKEFYLQKTISKVPILTKWIQICFFIFFISKESIVRFRHQMDRRKLMDKLEIDLQGN